MQCVFRLVNILLTMKNVTIWYPYRGRFKVLVEKKTRMTQVPDQSGKKTFPTMSYMRILRIGPFTLAILGNFS